MTQRGKNDWACRRGLLAGLVVISIIGLTGMVLVNAKPQWLRPVGHIIRWLHGEPGSKRVVNDLAAELQNTAFCEELQRWCVDILARFNSGHAVGDRDITPNLPIKAIVLPPEQLPAFLRDKWRDQPEVAMCLAMDGHAQSVFINWYQYGVVVGNTNYTSRDLPWTPYYEVPVQPGVITVWVDSK